MDALSTTAQADDSSGANPSSIKSDDSSPQRGSGTGSPPPNCAICLGTCRNKSFTDSCLHQFCFSCLLTWSKVKAECPLCKQAFRSIIHNVQSNNQYEEYLVEQRQNEDSSSRIDIDRITAATHRFRYRTTLTLPRRETIAIQQLLRHYPFMANVFPQVEPRPYPARRRLSPASFRRTVYRHNLWARLLPDFTGRFRDCTPEFYRYNSTQMHRLVPWLNRELHYLLNENAGHVSYVLSRILDLIPQHHINSAEFREAMHRYFGERTEHFLHELYCYASTPYDLAGYDRNVQYTTGIPTVINEVISSSDSEASVDSDIVMVSSSEPAEPPPGPSRIPAPVYPQSYISQPQAAPDNVIPIETISHSDTDDDSSEVMVVGYIKPPQDRTPEIVDLLGSDSDVIVQDVQPDPAVNSVKVTLKRHRSQNSCDDDKSRIDSDSSFVPSPAKRRRRYSNDSTTSGSSRTEGFSRRLSVHTRSAAAHQSSSSSSDDEHTSNRNKSKRKSSTSARDRRRSSKRPSRSCHIDVRNIPLPETDKRHSRKSHSGKGVKSSNKHSERNIVPSEPTIPEENSEPPPEQIANELDQPGTSGTSSHQQKRKHSKERKRRRRSRENKRLRSVVNVMYNSPRNTNEANINGNCSSTTNITEINNMDKDELSIDAQACKAGQCLSHNSCEAPPWNSRFPDSSTDSEDNLPLNLTLQKINPTSG